MVDLFKETKHMKKFITMAALLPMLFVACEKETITSSNSLTATATFDGQSETKTSYTDNGTDAQSALIVNWSDAESFKAYYSSTEYVTFSKTSGNTFTAEDVPAGVTSSTQFTGVYGTKATYNADGTVSIDFSGQDGTLENLGKYDVMTCTSTTEEGALKFAFEHKCAVLRIKLVNQASGSQQVRIQFNNASLNNSAEVTNIVPNTIPSSGIGTYTGKVIFALRLPSSFTGTQKTIYAVVPPIKYVNKGIYTVSSTYDTYFKTVQLTSSKQIEAGKMYDITLTCEAERTNIDPD